MAGRYKVADKAHRTVDGIVFDSKAEALRYSELKLLEKVGSITNLELQPKYELQPGFKHNAKRERSIIYTADFRYLLHGKEIVEDVKGHRTAVYRLKRKMLLYRHPDIDFREVDVNPKTYRRKAQ